MVSNISKVALVLIYLQMTLSPKQGVVEITSLWHFGRPLPAQTFMKAASSLRLLEIGKPSLISSAEVAEDCVAKFTSLMRARD